MGLFISLKKALNLAGPTPSFTGTIQSLKTGLIVYINNKLYTFCLSLSHCSKFPPKEKSLLTNSTVRGRGLQDIPLSVSYTNILYLTDIIY